VLTGDLTRSGYEILREHWRKRYSGKNFELSWEKALHDGALEGTGLAAKQVGAPNLANIADATTQPASAPSGSGQLRLVFRPDPCIGDGVWANNAWLQELHKPMVKFSWDNAVLLSAATAKALGVENEQVVELRFRGRSVSGPVCIFPGQPDDVATVYLGYGRTRAGMVGSNRGFNGYALRSSDAAWFGAGLEIIARSERYPLAFMQHEQLMHGRDLVRTRNIADLASAKPASQPSEQFRRTSLNLYTEWDYSKGNAWGMVIDQTACIGCNACVIGCQGENNIPVVGKEQTARGRFMHWLRIDTYYASEEHETDPAANPETYFQPVPCMHCEKAPCELVCPVGATAHDSEGTNNMVYNRCVGTRYCSNNCPYKVRRFNYLEFSHWTYPDMPEQLKLLRNPDVTVRTRGVMEKCTYCIQRINAARIESKKNPGDVPAGFVKDGEVLTACQQACPTDAIIFGNINDPKARVKKLKAEPTNYGLLEELNTQPRTTYLERIRNPNPAIKNV
jgi:molybdopterin-containing oxidoreductase family iron-sulfur binding subunit